MGECIYNLSHDKEFTRKKVQVIALQQSEQRRIEFIVQVAASYNPDMFIWINETGSDRRNSIRKYGYSLRGITPRICQLHVSGKRISAIPVLTTRDIEDLYLTSGSVNGDRFHVAVFYQHSYLLMDKTLEL